MHDTPTAWCHVRESRAAFRCCNRGPTPPWQPGPPRSSRSRWPDAFLLICAIETLDEGIAVGVPVGSAGQGDAQLLGVGEEALRRELRSVVVAQHHPHFVPVDAVGPHSDKGASNGLEHIGSAATAGEGPSQDGAVVAVDHRGEVTPAVSPHHTDVRSVCHSWLGWFTSKGLPWAFG
jgi:hypothetical protein